MDDEEGEDDGRDGGDDFSSLDLESMEEEARDVVREYSASLSLELDIGIVSSSVMLPLVYRKLLSFLEERWCFDHYVFCRSHLVM